MTGDIKDDFAKSSYWIEMAEYDIQTAEAMQQTARYLYVGFMCHQAVEKALKGRFVRFKPHDDLPFIHNLVRLAKAAEVFDSMDMDQQRLLIELQPLNIEARYPKKKDEVFKSLSKERCAKLVIDAKGLVTWINEI